MYQKNFAKLISIWLIFAAVGCQQKGVLQSSPATVAPATLRDVPALKLNFRFETDVPAPTVSGEAAQTEERNAAVQTDFDQNREQELVDKTIVSPNKQRVLAVYHRAEDAPAEYRLDMYSADGKLLRKINYDGMAVHFADTIVWSPNSETVAFVGMTRVAQTNPTAPTPTTPTENNAHASSSSEDTATDENANVAANTSATPQVEQPKAVLTFRTEQIYTCNADGNDVKPVTQNEGLIYFYYVWSPDSSSLAALAATFQEWRYLDYQAGVKREVFKPAGRPRLVEKNGRERRLDDNLTTVHPVWSPDSAKVAVAFETQVRIYDAIGDQPSQAAIPLKNQLLISSKNFDEDLQRKESSGNADAQMNSNAQSNTGTNANAQSNNQTNQQVGTLPDENTLVSFNPIIDLEWTEDKMLYLQTGYVKQMKNEADSARSYLRWHRLIFSPQAIALGN